MLGILLREGKAEPAEAHPEATGRLKALTAPGEGGHKGSWAVAMAPPGAREHLW